MKVSLLYGALMAIIGALAMYGLFFAGYHDTAEKMQASQWVGSTVGLVATVVCLALAMRDRRAQQPAGRPWGYGQAYLTGLLTGLCAMLIGAVFSYVYFAIVNPQFADVAAQIQTMRLEAKGLTGEQLEKVTRISRWVLNPVPMTIANAFVSFFASAVLALFVAIFFRRKLEAGEPVEPVSAPPPLA